MKHPSKPTCTVRPKVVTHNFSLPRSDVVLADHDNQNDVVSFSITIVESTVDLLLSNLACLVFVAMEGLFY